MRINLIVLYVSDLKASKEFYQSILNIEFVEETHGSGPTHYSATLFGCVLELYPKGSRAKSNLRIGFELDDLGLCIERLKLHKLPFQQREDNLVFIDLDGNTIELSSQ